MTVKDVINRVEKERLGCNISIEEYISALNILEQDIFTNIISAHEGGAVFTAHTSEDEVLLLPDIYADLYSFWLFARMDLACGDTVGYTNNMILYNNLMSEYSRYYTRNHMPTQKGKVRWY
ncbi:MAG: hypothetical protein IKU19_09580 [Clostridia bacterium]|nr:hypothetical protein [Clostridia bacterium]